MKFERIVRFVMPHDERTENPMTNYGIGSMRIYFILKGSKGAVQSIISTQFFLPKTINEYLNSNNSYWRNLLKDNNGNDSKPFQGWDVGFHSKKKPAYMNEDRAKSDCDIIGGKCYYDSSISQGERDQLGELFHEKGEEAIWEYLEKYYETTFQKKVKKEEEK